MHKAKRRRRLVDAFTRRYGSPPSVGVRAPGRVDLMGSHTDYNQGLVLTLPINREVWIVARPRGDSRVRMYSSNLESEIEFDVTADRLTVSESWGRYVQGVLLELRQAGHTLPGCDAMVHGTVPLASGLSSSAALESACATLFEKLGGFRLGGLPKALLAQRAENRWVGVNCGILDQYSSILGEKRKALLLDCRSLTHRHADVPRDVRIVICNTRAPRQLSGSEYDERRQACKQGAAWFREVYPEVRALRDVTPAMFEQHEAELMPLIARRCRFVIEENARVSGLAQALQTGDRPAIADITAASFTGARDLFEISVPAMESMFAAMRSAPGTVGCRQAGAGFGGCMVAIVEKNKVDDFCHETAVRYAASTGIRPEIYPVRTANGAGRLKGLG
jgi:galactokinase